MRELIIRFGSDWRIGTGRGIRGDVDERVRRDTDGLPIVPARTLTGMWRDGCERVAAALDTPARTGPWHDWVSVIFGSQPNVGVHDHAPIAATLSVRTATLPPELRSELVRDKRLVDALYGVRPGVRLDSATHHPTDKHLRMQETVRGGLTLRAPIAIADDGWTDEQRHTAAVLLALGAEQTTAIGGSRRRGLGRATLEMSTMDNKVRAMLNADRPPTPADLPTAAPESAVPAVDSAEDWVTITLRATCVDPVLSRSVATDGEVRGLPYVPGGKVLPAVFAKARTANIDLRPLIGMAGIVCEPLVPAVGDRPTRQAPRCLVEPKNSTTGTLTNRVLSRPPETSKPVRGKWLAVAGSDSVGSDSVDVDLVRPPTDVQLHNTVDDKAQRPTTDVGGLYSFESIPPGTRLTGRVRLRTTAATARTLAAELTGEWRLGTSKKDDYGRADVTATVDNPPRRTHGDTGRIVVWFVTDAVLMTDTLAPVSTVEQLVAAVEARLGYPVRLAPSTADTISHAVTFGRAEGWQARWTRPRPTLVTVSAGSVLVLRGDAIPGSALDSLERDGIGERRAEGFGIITINDPLLAKPVLTSRKPDQTPATTASAAPDADDRALVEELRAAALRREVEQKAATLSTKQLGALATTTATQRANLRGALAADDPRAAIKHFIEGIGDAKVRKSRWPAKAEAELAKLVADGGVWNLLDIKPQHRIADLEPWALRRVLAHLQAAGATAPGQKGDRDGA